MSNVPFTRLVPPNIRDDPKVEAATESTAQGVLDGVEANIPEVALWSRLEQVSDEILAELAFHLNRFDYDPDLPRAEREEMVRGALEWHAKAGTRWAVKDLLRRLLGEGNFEYRQRRRFRLGSSTLPHFCPMENDSDLGGVVDVVVDQDRADELGLTREDIESALNGRKRESVVHQVRFRGFRLGRSRLGIDLLG